MSAPMLSMVCNHINNYFETDDVTGLRLIHTGDFTVEGGSIALPFLQEGDYYRIFGSKRNNGVHQYGMDVLKDETFTGVIWEMHPPDEFLTLVDDISGWMDKYGDTMRNPYQSEDVIGVYRYTKMTSGKVTGDYIATWQNVYKDQLKQWRKLA